MTNFLYLMMWTLVLEMSRGNVTFPTPTSASTAVTGVNIDSADHTENSSTEAPEGLILNLSTSTWWTNDPQVNKEMYEKSYARLQEFILSRPAIIGRIPPYEAVHPVDDGGVLLKFTPFAILSVDEVQQTVTISSYVKVKWRDVSLQWDSAEYHDISLFSIKSSKIWTPDIVLPLSYDKGLYLKTPEYIRLYSDYYHNVGFTIPFQFTTLCDLDLGDYPFDSQKCEIIFTELCDRALFPLVQKNRDFEMTEDLHISGEWEITSSKSENRTGDLASLRFIVEMKRGSTYYVANVIIPLLLTSTMTMLVFGIPAEGGDKMSYLVSMFVSTSVFLGIINEETPRSIKQLPTVNVILMVVSSEIFVACLFTMLVLHLYRKRCSIRHPQNSGRDSNLGVAENSFGTDPSPKMEKMSNMMTVSQQNAPLPNHPRHGHFPQDVVKQPRFGDPMTKESGEPYDTGTRTSDNQMGLKDGPNGRYIRDRIFTCAWLSHCKLDLVFFLLFLALNLVLIIYAVFYWS